MENVAEIVQSGYNPFSDEVQQPQQPAAEVTTAQTNETAPASAPEQTEAQTQQAQPAQETVSEPSPFDPNQFVRERFGYESVEEAENEIKRLREAPKEPTIEFSNDLSKTLFEAIREGKADEVYDILNKQKNLERLTSSEVDAKTAVEIIKTNIQNKYQNLSPDEVDILFYETYNFPPKPTQGIDDTDEEYKASLDQWQNQVNYLEKRMIIDAKVTQPDLQKLKAEIKLPEFSRPESNNEATSQEEFEYLQQARQVYEKTLNAEFNNFKGFEITVKDADVEIPISFNVSEEERVALKNDLSDFDSDAYFESRWFNEDGTPNVRQAMQDKYLLENWTKIAQKIANEAASQRLVAHIKGTGNVTINKTMPQGTVQQSADSAYEALQKAVWS